MLPGDNDRVIAAIHALTPVELHNLSSYASLRVFLLGSKAGGRDREDLLQEAVIAVVSGRRPWNGIIPLHVHLRGCVRSISNGWCQQKKIDEISFEDLPGGNLDGNLLLHVFSHCSQNGREEEIDARRFVEGIYDAFPVGTVERTIIEQWELGMGQMDIMRILCLSESAFKAAVQRIRRSKVMRALGRKWRAHGKY